jgi:ABC-type uncharacterized transport system permease subunit
MLALLTDRQWLGAAGAFYLAGFLLGTWSLRRGGRPSGIPVYVLIGLGYVLQNAGLAVRGRAVGGCPLGNTFEIIQFTSWSAISLYLIVGVTFRSSLLGYLTAGLGSIFTLVAFAIPEWDAAHRSHIFGGNGWIEFHAALALFSYGVFALLALTSLLFVFRLYSLRSKRLGGWFFFLPSVMDLDQIGVRLLAFGVTLLAVSLAIAGTYWVQHPASASAAKVLVTPAVWLAYAVTLGLRLRGRLLARRFAWTCVALFLAALISLDLVERSRRPLAPEPVKVARQ